MSKHVHPTLFRRGHQSLLDDAFKRRLSERGAHPFKNGDAYSLNSNTKVGSLGRKIQECSVVEKILLELFQKSGYLVEGITWDWNNGYLVIRAFVYHRFQTSPNPLSKVNDGDIRSPKTKRRPSWTIRTVSWRSLLKEDLEFYKGFLEKCLNLKKGCVTLNVQAVSKDTFQNLHLYKGLLLTLQSVQKQKFFYDLVAVLCRASDEPSAELLAQFLRAEINQLRNQQVILDAVSQGLLYSLQLNDSILKAFLIKVSGRINGSDRAKVYQSRKGSIPLHTISSPIDYAFAEVRTKFGILSIKIYLKY